MKKTISDEEPNEEEWFEARDALKFASIALHSLEASKSVLEEALRDKKLHALADDIYIEPDIGPVGTWIKDKIYRRVYHISGQFDRGNIPKEFWSRRRISFYDHNLWNWERNTFATTDEPTINLMLDDDGKTFLTEVGNRYVAFGVWLLKDEVNAVINNHIKRFGPATGKDRKWKKWDPDVILRPFRQMIEESVFERNFGPFEKTGKQAKLERAIMTAAGEIDGEPPSEATARRLATKIIREFRSYENADSLKR